MANITGTSGNDILFGDEADASGMGGYDTIHGGAGNDQIDGRSGFDLLFGDEGDDILYVSPSTTARVGANVDGGAGFDTLQIVGAGSFTISESGGFFRLGPRPRDQIIFMGPPAGIERFVIGSTLNGSADSYTATADFGDSVTGYQFAVVGTSRAAIVTGSGHDTVSGGGGADTISLRGGNDIVTGGPGSDSFELARLSGNADVVGIDGGEGADSLNLLSAALAGRSTMIDLATGTASIGATRVNFTSIEDVVAEASSGSVTVLGDGADNRLETRGTGATIELHGRAGNDRLDSGDNGDRLFADEGDDIVFGNAGNDTIQGGSGDDILSGGNGSDDIAGGDGHDFLYGGHGPSDAGNADTLSGGGGNDHIFGNAPNHLNNPDDGGDLIDAGDGSDYVNGNGGNDTIDGGAGGDRLQGGRGNDSISGGAGPDQINGDIGADTIDGGEGNDIIRGGQDDDDLRGGWGNDILFGDLGNDVLRGGPGVDIMTGGDGTDRFDFSAVGAAAIDPAGISTILDFADGIDRVAIGFAIVGDSILRSASNFASVAEAQSTAQVLLSANAGARQVAALQVGTDAYLFYSAADSGMVDAIVAIRNVSAAAIGAEDFG